MKQQPHTPSTTLRELKIALAIMLFLSLAPMPYGYYQLVRLGGLILFGYLSYTHFKTNNEPRALIYLALALLFQPFYKLVIGRTMWNIIDLVVGIWLLHTAIKGGKRESE